MKLNHLNYFGLKANREYMSVSQWKSFGKCQHMALGEVKGKYKRETTTAMLVGQYVDAHFDGTMEVFRFQHPELFTRNGTLKQNFVQADEIIKRIERDKLFMKYISGEKQVIMTGEIRGVPVKIMMDSLHPDKMIVDRKIMKDFEPEYVSEKGLLPWFEAWGYDVQGGVYQEIVRQNTGLKLPFYLAAATKEKTTDIDIIHIDQKALDFGLEQFSESIELYDAIKKGVIEAERCNKCEYCKHTKVLKAPTSSEEFYLI